MAPYKHPRTAAGRQDTSPPLISIVKKVMAMARSEPAAERSTASSASARILSCVLAPPATVGDAVPDEEGEGGGAEGGEAEEDAHLADELVVAVLRDAGGRRVEGRLQRRREPRGAEQDDQADLGEAQVGDPPGTRRPWRLLPSRSASKSKERGLLIGLTTPIHRKISQLDYFGTSPRWGNGG